MLSHIPTWVPVLFVFLVAFGWLQSRARMVHPRSPIILAAAMLVLSWAGLLSAFGTNWPAIAAWLIGFGLMVTAGQSLFAPQGMRSGVSGGRIHLPGSWLPFGLLMAIFSVRFVLGFAQGVDSPLLTTVGFSAAIGAVLGCLSGGFAARALVIVQFAFELRRQRTPSEAVPVQSVLIEKDSSAFQIG